MRKLTLALIAWNAAMAQQEERVVIPQVADGGGWKTRIALVNRSLSLPAKPLINFYGQDGRPLAFSLLGLGLVSTVERTIQPGGSLILETAGTQPNVQAGWLEVQSGADDGTTGPGYIPLAFLAPDTPPRLAATAPVTAFITFRQRVEGRPDFETSVLSIPADTRTLAFAMDNQENYVTSIAVANTQNSPVEAMVIFRAAAGALIDQQTLTLPARGHAFFETINRFPASRNQRGTVEFLAPTGRLAALCLWFNPSGPFASVPSFALAR